MEGCNKHHRMNGYCNLHAQRLRKHGDPNIVLKTPGPSNFHTSLEEKFFDSFEIVTETGCWIWTGGSAINGYGMMTWKKKQYRAHRYSYERFVGIIPENMNVCHKCDVTYCVNPHHLFLGTTADNMHDKNKKNRQAKGEKLGRAKLMEADIRYIRNCNLSSKELAKKYSVSHANICSIRKYKTWKHVS